MVSVYTMHPRPHPRTPPPQTHTYFSKLCYNRQNPAGDWELIALNKVWVTSWNIIYKCVYRFLEWQMCSFFVLPFVVPGCWVIRVAYWLARCSSVLSSFTDWCHVLVFLLSYLALLIGALFLCFFLSYLALLIGTLFLCFFCLIYLYWLAPCSCVSSVLSSFTDWCLVLVFLLSYLALLIGALFLCFFCPI